MPYFAYGIHTKIDLHVQYRWLFKKIAIYESGDYRAIGKLVATSILQGGPGLPIFLPAVWNYIVRSDGSMQGMAMPDPLVKNLIKQVQVQLDFFFFVRGVPVITLKVYVRGSTWSLCSKRQKL